MLPGQVEFRFGISNVCFASNKKWSLLIRYCEMDSYDERDYEKCFRLFNSLSGVTHICISNLTVIGSDNGLSPGRRQAIIWTNTGILFIGPLGTNLSEIFIKILTFSCIWKCPLGNIINIHLHFVSFLHIDMTQENCYLSKRRTYIFYKVNIMAADVLVT